MRIPDSLLERVLEISVETGDIAARSAHIERNNLRKTGLTPRSCCTDNSTGRSAQQTIARTKGRPRYKPTGTRHDPDPPSHRALNTIEVGFHDRTQRCIDHRRLRTRQNLDQRRKRMRTGDVLKTPFQQKILHPLLMLRIPVTVQKSDRANRSAHFHQPLHRLLESIEIERLDNLTGRIEPLPDLYHFRVKRRWFLNIQRKEIGTLLSADSKRIGKSCCYEKDCFCALSFKKSIRRTRRCDPER